MNILKTFALLISLVISTNSYAEGVKNQVAVVDIQLILAKSTAANDVRTKISKTRDLYQAQITKKEEDLRKSDEKLSERRSLITADKFKKEKKQFTDKIIKVQRDVQEKRANLDRQSADALDQIQGKILSIVKKVSMLKNLDLVLPKSQVFFASPEMDITNDVLIILNQEMPFITLKNSTKK